MKHHIRLVLSLAMACSTAAVLSAQTPPRPDTPTTQPAPRGETPGAVTTVSGCLKMEKDVPGLTPNVAERAGVGEDFILMNVKPAASPSGSGSTRALMYRIEGLTSDELKKHVNHHVELQGTVDDRGSAPTSAAPTTAKPGAAGGTSDTAAKPKDFRATSLKMVSTTCPSGTS